MSDYPNSIPGFTSQTKGLIGTSAFINDVTDELLAGFLEFGTLPKGRFADVKTRLDSIHRLGPRNLIINGGFYFGQRGTSFVNPANNDYTLDRWRFNKSGTTPPTVTVSQVSTGSGFALRYDITVAGSGTPITEARQFVENPPDSALNGRTISFFARVKASVAGKVRLFLNNGAGTSFSTFHTGGGAYEDLRIEGIVHSTGDPFMGLTINPADFTGIIDMADVMLVIGDKVEGYTPLPADLELARCQRYYEKSYNVNVNPGTATAMIEYIGSPAAAGTNLVRLATKFKVSKRAVPTINFYDSAGISGVVTRDNNGTETNGQAVVAGTVGLNGFAFNVTPAAAATAIGWHWTANAEF